MSDVMVDDNGDEPRRWAPSRVASAAILVVLVLGGLAYGIYSLVNTSSTTTTRPHAVEPALKPKQNSAPAKPATTPSATTTPTAPSSSTTAPQSHSLTNTGPGDAALYGFMAATIIGTLSHYGWRRFKRNQS